MAGSSSGAALTVCLPDVTPEPFQLVLTYIYTDSIDPTENDREQGSNQIVLLMMEVRLNRVALFLEFDLEHPTDWIGMEWKYEYIPLSGVPPRCPVPHASTGAPDSPIFGSGDQSQKRAARRAKR